MRTVWLAAMMSWSLGCAGDHACTTAYCTNSVEVRFAAPLPFGDDVLELDLDGTQLRCGLNGDVGATPQCTTEMGVFVYPFETGVGRVDLHKRPNHLTFRVVRDGTVLREVTLSPAYETVYINGPWCEPVCDIAKLTL
jgi:hypothetical protein